MHDFPYRLSVAAISLIAAFAATGCGGGSSGSSTSNAKEDGDPQARLQRLAGPGYKVGCRPSGNGEQVQVTCTVDHKAPMDYDEVRRAYLSDSQRLGVEQMIRHRDFGLLELTYRADPGDGSTTMQRYSCAMSVALEDNEHGAAASGSSTGRGYDCGR
jgi:hypothetical protein